MLTFILSMLLTAGFQTGISVQDQQPPEQLSATPASTTVSDGRREAQKGGSIQGKVIGADTAAGLRKTTLMLRRVDSQTGDKPSTTQTDQGGDYRFEDVKPGKYTLAASRNGYVRQVYGQKGADPFSPAGITLDVKPGEALESINFRLIRGGAVEGRILDVDNEPLANVMVQLMVYRSFQGKRRLMPTGMAQTDDRGHYRIFNVPPGSYILSSTYLSFEAPGGSSPFSPTYYPGVSTPQEATKIQVSAARELTGIDLILTEAVAYTISGKIVGSDGKPVINGWVNPMRLPMTEMMFALGGDNSTDSQGNFKLTNVFPGKYRLVAMTNREGKQQTASTQVEVTNADVEGILITMGEGAEIAGRLIVEEMVEDLDIRRLRVSLVADPERGGLFMGWGTGGEVKDNLTFRLVNLSESEGRFQVTGLKETTFVKSIRVEGREVVDQTVEIKGSGRLEGVEIVISSEGASVRGVVRQEENGPVVKGATVIAFPADIEKRFPNSRFIKTAQTDQQGGYSLRGFPPSEYLISALKKHEAGLESDENFLKELEKVAVKVKLNPGEDKTESLIAVDPPEVE